jgi:hypothetical protein
MKEQRVGEGPDMWRSSIGLRLLILFLGITVVRIGRVPITDR